MYYQLAGAKAPASVNEALQWIIPSIRSDQQIQTDKQRLKEILKIDPEILCRRQTRCQARNEDRMG